MLERHRQIIKDCIFRKLWRANLLAEALARHGGHEGFTIEVSHHWRFRCLLVCHIAPSEHVWVSSEGKIVVEEDARVDDLVNLGRPLALKQELDVLHSVPLDDVVATNGLGEANVAE